jgi:hypothetical protein
MRGNNDKKVIDNSRDEELIQAFRSIWLDNWFLVKTFTDEDIVVSEIEYVFKIAIEL